MKKEQLKGEELAAALLEVSDKITKKDKYHACLKFREDPFTPLDIRTVTDMLSGNPEKIKNEELANDLLEFFQGRAAQYKELDEQQKNDAA